MISCVGLLIAASFPLPASARSPAAPGARSESESKGRTKNDGRSRLDRLEQASGETTAFRQLVRAAIDDHPKLESIRARVRQLDERVQGTGVRPDPTVKFGAKAFPWNEPWLTGAMVSRFQLSITQPIWYPGELKAKKEVVRSKSRAVEPTVDDAAIRLITRAAGDFFAVYRIDRTVAALQKEKEPVRRVIDLLESRLPTGKSSLVRVERARLQLTRIRDRILRLRLERPSRIESLNATLNRPAASPVNPPEPDGLLDESGEPLPELSALVDRAMERRPAVTALERRKEVAEAKARAASWERLPDLSVFGDWRFRKQPSGMDGTDMFSIGIGGTLPIFSPAKAESAEDASRAEVARLDAKIRKFRLEVRERLQRHRTRLHRASEQLEFVREDLLPQAKRARQAALAGLDAGKARFEDWLQSQRRVVDIRTRIASLEAKVRKQRTIISGITGSLIDGSKP
ncbi:MAG: TolC family protein [Bradymonadaceae bacterium]